MESTLCGLFAYTLPTRLHVSLTPTLVQIRGKFYQRAKALFVSWRPSWTSQLQRVCTVTQSEKKILTIQYNKLRQESGMMIDVWAIFPRLRSTPLFIHALLYSGKCFTQSYTTSFPGSSLYLEKVLSRGSERTLGTRFPRCHTIFGNYLLQRAPIHWLFPIVTWHLKLRKLWRQTGNSSLLPAECWPLLHQSRSQRFVPLDQRSENESSGQELWHPRTQRLRSFGQRSGTNDPGLRPWKDPIWSPQIADFRLNCACLTCIAHPFDAALI